MSHLRGTDGYDVRYLEHPNKWVTRVFFLVMFSIPLVLKYL